MPHSSEQIGFQNRTLTAVDRLNQALRRCQVAGGILERLGAEAAASTTSSSGTERQDGRHIRLDAGLCGGRWRAVAAGRPRRHPVLPGRVGPTHTLFTTPLLYTVFKKIKYYTHICIAKIHTAIQK
jgi:hypothetical protein